MLSGCASRSGGIHGKGTKETTRVLPELDPAIWAAVIAITLTAGLVKGAIGFAMPLIMVSGLTTVLEPRLAVAGIILPIVVSNALQTFRTGWGPAIAAVRDFWRYILIVCIAIAVFAQIVPQLDPRVFYLVLGVPVVALSIMQLAGIRLHIREPNRWWAEWVIGLISGVLGGLAGTWGPTTVLYLLAIDTPKARQIVVQGVIYGLGAVTLLFAHIHSGILNRGTVPFSAFLLIPGVIGMWIGFRIQDRLDQTLFRRVTLVVLTVAGLNLIRKGLLG
jgi:uncharacterized membrane protein YfcA